MMADPKLPSATQLLRDLQTDSALKHQPIAPTGLSPQLALLRHWQAERLTQTYHDWLADPRYQSACQFFLSDIYAPRDFSQRNHDVERVAAFLGRIFPAAMLQLLEDVIELNSLTDRLDARLVDVLVNQLGVTDTITPTLYAEGYRLCDNYTERVHQIDLIIRIVTELGKGAQRRIIGIALQVVRVPVQQAGWTELYEFVEHGYQAFKAMRDIETFTTILEQREKQLLEQWFSIEPRHHKR
jgi:hypothetical protein